MSKLNEDYIEALSPRPMSNPEDKKKEITSIMEYQGIEEKEMQGALMNYEASLQMQQKHKVGINATYEIRKEEETILLWNSMVLL